MCSPRKSQQMMMSCWWLHVLYLQCMREDRLEAFADVDLEGYNSCCCRIQSVLVIVILLGLEKKGNIYSVKFSIC